MEINKEDIAKACYPKWITIVFIIKNGNNIKILIT